MVKEAEEFAAEDQAQKRRVEALEELSSAVYTLKTQVSDADGLGGKLSAVDKETILDELKSASEWVDEHGHGQVGTSVDDIEARLAEMRAVVNPIVTHLYETSAEDEDPNPFWEDEECGTNQHQHKHTEL